MQQRIKSGMCWCIWWGFEGALLQRSPAVRGARYLPEGGQCLEAGAEEEVFYHDYRPFPGEARQISPSDKMRHAAGACKENIILFPCSIVIGWGVFIFGLVNAVMACIYYLRRRVSIKCRGIFYFYVLICCRIFRSIMYWMVCRFPIVLHTWVRCLQMLNVLCSSVICLFFCVCGSSIRMRGLLWDLRWWGPAPHFLFKDFYFDMRV